MAHATVQQADSLPNHHPGTRNERKPGTLRDAGNMLETIMASVTTPPPQGKQVLREDPPDTAQANVPLVPLIAITQIKDVRDSPSRKRLQESPQSGEPSPSHGDSSSPTSNPLLEPEDALQ
ncbi:hypothetical protein NQZ68_005140 [Dissostichus eleginoides]|nr:hypothetical protein NQZ68_005140 [Dissostichus eleginoides]